MKRHQELVADHHLLLIRLRIANSGPNVIRDLPLQQHTNTSQPGGCACCALTCPIIVEPYCRQAGLFVASRTWTALVVLL
jgi:hypothetical protein